MAPTTCDRTQEVAKRLAAAYECLSPGGGVYPGQHCAACCYGTGIAATSMEEFETAQVLLAVPSLVAEIRRLRSESENATDTDTSPTHIRLICWDHHHVQAISPEQLRQLRIAPTCTAMENDRICGSPIWAVEHVGEPKLYVGRPPHRDWASWADCSWHYEWERAEYEVAELADGEAS